MSMLFCFITYTFIVLCWLYNSIILQITENVPIYMTVSVCYWISLAKRDQSLQRNICMIFYTQKITQFSCIVAYKMDNFLHNKK